MSRRAALALTLILSAIPAWSQFTPQELQAARQDPAAYTLDESSLRIDKLGPAVSPTVVPPPSPDAGTDPTVILNNIINIGLKIWKIIVDNKPIVNIKTEYATALPEGVKGWASMGGWQPPKGEIYALSAKNGYGATVIKVRYQVLRTYGGSYKGHGKFLTAVTVEPLLVEVAWGYKFTMAAEVPESSIVNVGTTEDPLAAMMAKLSWRIQTAVKDSSGNALYFLQGDGVFREIGGPFTDRSLEKARTSAAALADRPALLP